MAFKLDGKETSRKIREEIQKEVQSLMHQGGQIPHLVAVLVGNDPASESYVAGKVRDCEQIGFKSTLRRFNSEITEESLLQVVDELNHDADVDGFIVQLPLPDHISVEKIIEQIRPEKDVDGFHPVNVGRMAKSLPAYVSATPFGIMELLRRYDIETSGKHCVVIGRSDIVGTPISILLSRNSNPGNCTVTICHSRTKNLSEIARQADILIAAIGRPGFVDGSMVKEGAVVIDVGISRVEDETKKSGFRLVGDVKFEEAEAKASYITPVPGGVGPMTRAGLLQNTLLAAQKKIYT